MRFSLQPEQRPEQKMRTLSIDEILSLSQKLPGDKPALEHYFSPSRKESFVKDFLHYLNTGLLEARHGKLDSDLFVVFVLSFQFVAPLLEIPSEKELGLFYRILEKNYDTGNVDLNLHFGMENYDRNMIPEEVAMKAFREELDESYAGNREVKESVRKRLKRDAVEAIMIWQREQSIPALAEAFGRSIVIPSFFDYRDKKLIRFYRSTAEGIQYLISIPEELD